MQPGDQHRNNPGFANPFLESQISPYTAAEIATLQARLDQKLGPEYISAKPGPGGKKVHYLNSEKCISLANQVFGFNGWCSSIKGMEVDFLDQDKNGKFSIGLSVTIRITLKDGTYHEDVGYGSYEGGKSKAQVFEKAKKEGTTDGLKRTLRTFGSVLGNCLYDKDYLEKVVRMRATPTVFDEKALHRANHNFNNSALIAKRENASALAADAATSANAETSTPETFDEYGGDELEELGIFGDGDDVFDDLMPDEFAVDVSSAEIETPSKPGLDQATKPQNRPRNVTTIQPRRNTPSPTKQLAQPPIQPSVPPPMAAPPRPAQGAPGPKFGQGARAQPQTINRPPPPKSNNRPGSNIQQSGSLRPQMGNLPNPQAAQNQRAAPNPQIKQGQPNTPSCDQRTVPTMKAPQLQERPETSPNLQTPHNPPVGFFTGRAALNLDNENSMIPDQAPIFNPHRPTTLPRSSGIDHTKSSPIPRKHIQGQVGAAALSPPNFQNPSLTANRQIGAPPQRNAFRAPGMAGIKRAAESNPAPNGGNGKPPLGPVSGPQLNTKTGDVGGNDPKRART